MNVEELEKIIETVMKENNAFEEVLTESSTASVENSLILSSMNEIFSRLEKGPIHLEENFSHPYLKNNLHTLFAKRAAQPLIEAKVIIPFHLVEAIRDKVIDRLSNTTFEFQNVPTVYYDVYDKAGVLESRKVGKVKEYRFVEINHNSGSITAKIQGKINWD